MKALILAAGKGKRLGQLSQDIPKCLLVLNGVPLLSYQLDALERAGVTDITVVAGHLADQVKNFCQNRCRVIVNERYEETDSIYSMWLAKPHLVGHDFLFMNGDVVYDDRLIAEFIEHKERTACLIDDTKPYRPQEYQLAVKDGRLTEFGRGLPAAISAGESAQLEKIGASDSVLFFKRIDELVGEGQTGRFPTAAYDVLLRDSHIAAVFNGGRKWFEIDTMDDYESCCMFLAKMPRRSASTVSRFPPSWRRNAVIKALERFIRQTPYYGGIKDGLRRHLWIVHFVPALLRMPGRACRLWRPLYSGELTCTGFDMQMYGAPTLRTLLQEARPFGLRPFLAWGTLLGCVREGGFIKNDNDIDLAMMDRDFVRIGRLKEAMLRRGFRIRIDTRYKLSLYHPRGERLYIDIDRVYEKNDRMVMTNADADRKNFYNYYFPREAFAGFKAVKFQDGIDVLIPKNPEKFLEAVYGDWRTPQQKAHYLYGPLNLEVEPKE